jgi:ATP-binding cassette subfamily B protein
VRFQGIRELRRILGFGRYPALLAGGLAAAVSATAAQLTVPLIIRRIIDGALLAPEGGRLARWALLLAGTAIAAGILRELQVLAFALLEQRSLADLRAALLRHLHRLPVSHFEGERSGRLNALFMTEATNTTRLFNPILSESALAALQLAGVILAVAIQFGALVVVPLVLIPIYISTPLWLGRATRRAARRAADARAEATAEVQDAIDLAREIKSLTQESWNARRLAGRFQEVLRRQLRLSVLTSFYGLSHVVFMLTVAALYWYGGRQVQGGGMTVGGLIALVWYVGLLAGPVNQLVGMQARVQTVLGSAGRIFEFLDAPAEVDDDRRETLPHGRHAVEFSAVRFAYPDNPRAALEDIDFRAEPGQRIAVVGPSGAGKSTLIHLLLRFYEPQAGEVRIAGRDVRAYRLASLRREVSLVPQEPRLFPVSVRENIRLGRPDADPAAIERAAKLAYADGFVRALPAGYDTEVGERGCRLSVGQKQRIAIARVVLRDPSVLILDEPTSALDAESEHLVREALERAMAGRTTFIVAHRLDSVLRCDSILVLDQGRLLDRGRHEELLARCELYRRLVSLQFRPQEEPAPELVAAGDPAG